MCVQFDMCLMERKDQNASICWRGLLQMGFTALDPHIAKTDSLCSRALLQFAFCRDSGGNAEGKSGVIPSPCPAESDSRQVSPKGGAGNVFDDMLKSSWSA